ncbi:MAG TPA: hypothetical protein VNH13_09130, partial [Candidatus Acidoferrales bacterium]|nr:hypothetical protein [Candidatus Acidoferrales bacterium]
IVDSATATASALSELLLINGLEAPGSSRGTAADPGRAGHDAPPAAEVAPIHAQLTTGDVEAFRRIADRMFGAEFPDVTGIDLGAAASAGPA